MLTRREHEIVAAAADALVPGFPALPPADRARATADVARFLAQQVGAMPVVLRTPYRAALVAFDLAAVVRARRAFRRLETAGRVAHVAWWEDLGGLATRNFVKLLRSCALLAWFDHPLVTAWLGGADRSGEAA